MILGDLIKQYRAENNLSMDDFSRKAGLSKAYISILERNLNPVNNKPIVPSLETIKAVSNAIDMDFNRVIALLDGNQEVSLIQNDENELILSETAHKNKDENQLLIKYRALDTRGKETIRNILDIEYNRNKEKTQVDSDIVDFGGIAAKDGEHFSVAQTKKELKDTEEVNKKLHSPDCYKNKD